MSTETSGVTDVRMLKKRGQIYLHSTDMINMLYELARDYEAMGQPNDARVVRIIADGLVDDLR